MFTLEQIGQMLQTDMNYLKSQLIYWDLRTPGVHRKDWIKAINIAPLGAPEEWRVTEAEFIRWLKAKRIRIYEPVAVSNSFL